MKKEETTQQTHWYVYPTDGGHTNATIARAQNGEGFLTDILCADKRRRNFWEVDLEFIHQLVARMNVEATAFDVYMASGENKPQSFNLGWTKKKNNCPLVVIAHPVTGDKKGNVRKVRQIIRDLTKKPTLDILPWFPFEILEALHEDNPEERQKGLYMCLSMIKKAEELWLYGDHVSDGMKTQVILALIHGIPVKPKTPGTLRDFKRIKGNRFEYALAKAS